MAIELSIRSLICASLGFHVLVEGTRRGRIWSKFSGSIPVKQAHDAVPWWYMKGHFCKKILLFFVSTHTAFKNANNSREGGHDVRLTWWRSKQWPVHRWNTGGRWYTPYLPLGESLAHRRYEQQACRIDRSAGRMSQELGGLVMVTKGNNACDHNAIYTVRTSFNSSIMYHHLGTLQNPNGVYQRLSVKAEESCTGRDTRTSLKFEVLGAPHLSETMYSIPKL